MPVQPTYFPPFITSYSCVALETILTSKPHPSKRTTVSGEGTQQPVDDRKIEAKLPSTPATLGSSCAYWDAGRLLVLLVSRDSPYPAMRYWEMCKMRFRQSSRNSADYCWLLATFPASTSTTSSSSSPPEDVKPFWSTCFQHVFLYEHCGSWR